MIGKIPSVAEVEAFLADTAPTSAPAWSTNLLAPRRPRAAFRQHLARADAGRRGREYRIANQHAAVRNLAAVAVRGQHALRPAGQRVADGAGRSGAASSANNVRRFVPSPVAFFQANEQKPEMIAASTTRIFLGVQVQCAQCHDHPFSHWTRREFWSLAAFFDRRPARNARSQAARRQRQRDLDSRNRDRRRAGVSRRHQARLASERQQARAAVALDHAGRQSLSLPGRRSIGCGIISWGAASSIRSTIWTRPTRRRIPSCSTNWRGNSRRTILT